MELHASTVVPPEGKELDDMMTIAKEKKMFLWVQDNQKRSLSNVNNHYVVVYSSSLCAGILYSGQVMGVVNEMNSFKLSRGAMMRISCSSH